MLAVAPIVVIAGMLLVGPADLEPEDGGGVTPQTGWYEAACRSWRAHLLSRIAGLRSVGELDASDFAQFSGAVARAEESCVDERWQGLRLFASLDRALGEWRGANDRPEDPDEAPDADR